MDSISVAEENLRSGATAIAEEAMKKPTKKEKRRKKKTAATVECEAFHGLSTPESACINVDEKPPNDCKSHRKQWLEANSENVDEEKPSRITEELSVHEAKDGSELQDVIGDGGNGAIEKQKVGDFSERKSKKKKKKKKTLPINEILANEKERKEDISTKELKEKNNCPSVEATSAESSGVGATFHNKPNDDHKSISSTTKKKTNHILSDALCGHSDKEKCSAKVVHERENREISMNNEPSSMASGNTKKQENDLAKFTNKTSLSQPKTREK